MPTRASRGTLSLRIARARTRDPLTGNGRELIVITGPPGAGKSSVSEHLANQFEPSALVAGDNFFRHDQTGYHPAVAAPVAPSEHPSSSRQLQLLLAG